MASCTIEEVEDTEEFSASELERQLGLALVKQAEGDPAKLLGTVLDFLARKTNFFKHGDPEARVLEAFRAAGAAARAGSGGGGGADPVRERAPWRGATPARGAALGRGGQRRRAGRAARPCAWLREPV